MPPENKNKLPPEDSHVETGGETATLLRADVEKWEGVVQRMRDSKRADIESRVLAVLEAMLAVQPDAHPTVFTISRNRPATTASKGRCRP